MDRKTGVTSGGKKMHSMSQAQVIHIGGDQNSFKVVTTMRRDQDAGAVSIVYVPVINTFDAATKKPFLFTDNAEAYIGPAFPSDGLPRDDVRLSAVGRHQEVEAFEGSYDSRTHAPRQGTARFLQLGKACPVKGPRVAALRT